MVEEQRDSLSVKDLIVALPVFAGTLAITYDVGYFYGFDMGYFTMFSLAEHIVFAMQAIPVAFGVALTIPTGIVSFELGARKAQKETPAIPGEGTSVEELKKIQAQVQAYFRKSQRELLFFSAIFTAFGAVAMWFKYYLVGALAIVLGSAGVFAFVLPDIFLRRRAILAWYTVGLVVVGFFLGFQNARGILAETSAKHVITVSDGELRGHLVRSGERGVLFYEPSSNKISFLVWGDVKRIQSVK